MTEGNADPVQRRFRRDDFLELAGGSGRRDAPGRAGRGGRAAGAQLAAESGRLQVLDWAGYGNDGGQSMFAAYVKKHPTNKPQFTYMTNESDALAKIHAGLQARTSSGRTSAGSSTSRRAASCSRGTRR